MKKWKFLCVLFIIMITGLACQSTKGTSEVNHKEAARYKNQSNAEDQIKEEKYQKDGIKARYPKIVSGASEEKIKIWNQIIETDFSKILQIYNFDPFPELESLPTKIPVILKINNEIKLNNSQFLSIFYEAAYNNPYSAYPTDLVYTTNMDKERDQRLKLSDLVSLDADFVKNFRTWDFKSYEEGNEVLDQAIRKYISDLSDEDLLLGFKAADQIGANNPWGIFSYLTPDRLGISVSVPNYIGDHVEFERNYSELKDFLKPGFEW